MNDKMRFTPSNITVKRGETVKFVVPNSGKLRHEMVIGSQTGKIGFACLQRDILRLG